MGHIAICWQQNMRDYLYFMFYLEYLQSAISKLPQDEKDAYCVNGKLYDDVGLYIQVLLAITHTPLLLLTKR